MMRVMPGMRLRVDTLSASMNTACHSSTGQQHHEDIALLGRNRTSVRAGAAPFLPGSLATSVRNLIHSNPENSFFRFNKGTPA